MSLRYVTNMVVVMLAGLVVICSQAFSSSVEGWLALGIAIAIVGMTAVVQLDRARGIGQRVVDLAAVVLGVAAIVTSAVYSGSTVTWLAFSQFLGFVGLGVTGLTMHEVESWRARHGLQPLWGVKPEPSGYQATSREAGRLAA
jgi:hypothetical protein